MMSDEELSEDEEEIIVYVELEGTVGSNTLSMEQLQLDMIGIDTEHPIMQINGKFYEGTYEDALGTYMFFTKEDSPIPHDPVFDVAPTLKYVTKTRKVLKMQRIFIKHRTEVLGDSENNRCIPNLNTISEAGVPVKYQEEALSFWKTVRDGRMDALNSYLEKQRIREEKKSKGIEVDSESDEDNPFAAYTQKATSTTESQPLDETVQTKGTEEISENVEKPEETGKVDTTKNENDNLEALQNLAIQETDNVIPEGIEPQGNESEKRKPGTRGGRKKKTVVVHDPKRKRCRRKQVLVKEKAPVEVKPMETEQDNNKEEEEKSKQIADEPKTLEVSNTCPLKSESTTEVETGCQEEVTEEDLAANIEMSMAHEKMLKQLKREAKMKEIAERLKTMAEERKKSD